MKAILQGALLAAVCVSCSSAASPDPTSNTGGTSGAPATGGAAVSEGGATTGGSSATGGTLATGGSATTGGNSATGGSVVTGGVGSATGGSSAAGGALGRGGGSSGGSATTGGSSSVAGAAATGGRSGTGGSTSTGGGGGAGGAGGASVTGSRSPGCDTPIPTLPNRKTQQTMTIDGKTRFYLLNVPSNADNKTAMPLVFALHGYNMNNLSLVDLYDFTAQSGNKAITVLPQGEGDDPGTTSKWGSGISSTFSANSANYTFLQTLMADIENRFCVDKSRVFITGFSMGGLFTNSIACAHSDWFRAFAPVEGAGPGSCADKNAKPAIMIHQGTADTTVEPASGEASRDFWIKQNGCDQTTTSTLTGCTSYGNCAQPVTYCLGNWGHTVDKIAKANIWSFFSTF